MYIIHFIIGDENHWKMFNSYTEVMDFKGYCDNPEKVIKFCPTSDEPEVIWKTSWANFAKVGEPLVMPVIDEKDFDDNEKSLIIEECVNKVHNVIYGLAEQLKRIGGK